MMEDPFHFLPHAIGVIVVLAATVAAAHAILYKRDPRSAVGWVGIIVLFPLVGPFVYLLLGVNRIQRRAAKLRVRAPRRSNALHTHACSLRRLEHALPENARHLVTLARAVNRITTRPLLVGNQLKPLLNGDETYPAMLSAIKSAQHTVTLATYIFDRDRVGLCFVEALAEAVERGVEVRVLIDDAGARYSFPTIVRLLKQHRVPVARFMPTLHPLRTMYSNLRSHRKIMVVDGHIGYTGGLNVRADHVLKEPTRFPVQDTHFEIQGPVVAQLQRTFAEDWAFTTGEILAGEEKWFPVLRSCGETMARGISDGPDEDFDKLRQVLLSALACARRRIRIVTPYFLPDQAIIAALNVAALRDVEVEILLPAKNNLRLVGWAIRAQLWQVLERGCLVYFTPPPFDHSKLFTVDETWALIGSANWDPRSLRLNFEFCVEVYDPQFVSVLDRIIDSKRAAAHRVTLSEMDSRPLGQRLRDGAARLLFPYL